MLPHVLAILLASQPDDIQIKRDFVAECNRALDAVPPNDKAWPEYLKALEIMRPWDPDDRLAKPPLHIEPGDTDWDEIEAWLLSNREAIAFIKSAAGRPCICRRWSDGFAPEEARILKQQAEPATASPELLMLSLPHLGEARRIALMLRLEARRAHAGSDAKEFVEVLHALLGLSDQLLSEKTLIAQLVGMFVLSYACDSIDEALATNAQVFTASDLRAVRKRLSQLQDGRPIRIQLPLERDMLFDLLQRTFSDDGNGDGRITQKGSRRFRQIVETLTERDKPNRHDPNELSDGLIYLTMSSRMASRKEILIEHDRWLVLADQMYDQSLWDWRRADFDAQCEKLSKDPWKYAPAAMMLVAVAKGFLAMWQARQRQAASAATLAIMEFRQTRDRWPSSLDELVPDYLAAKPIDMYTGDSLIFRIENDRPRLYARGVDQDDDRGIPMDRRNSPFAGNWQTTSVGERKSGDWLLFSPFKAADE